MVVQPWGVHGLRFSSREVGFFFLTLALFPNVYSIVEVLCYLLS